MNTINFDNITQVCVVVRNLEESAKNYCDLFGMKMPEVYFVPPEEITHAKYKGRPAKCQTKLVVFKMGTILLELIEPDKNYPSVWKDFLDEHGEGIQNISFAVPDFKEVIDRLDSEGLPVIHIGEFEPGKCWANVDTRKKLGIILNLKDM